MELQPTIHKPPLRFDGVLIPLRSVKKIVYHHMSRQEWDLNDVHEFHKQKGWKGIGYNYWIGYDGTIYEARGECIGAHVLGWNSKSLGIGFQGDFEVQQVTERQMESGAWLTAYFMEKYGLKLKDVVGHKDLNPLTICPGPNFDIMKMKQRVRSFLAHRQN